MVKTRFAPSPSGYLHIGGVRTALYAWLYARNQGGEFLLRIENTHIQRSSQESINSIMEGLKWLGLNHDGEVIYQADRFDIYKNKVNELIQEGKAYESDGAVRLKSDRSSDIIIPDQVFGDIKVNKDELDDFIIMRSNGAPTYHLAVVVDDHESQITHVMRGDDHLKNTARHIQLMEAFNYSIPQFVHLPMILGPDGARLSKRHGAMNVLHYRDEGFSPEALLNYLVRLGWSKGDQEIFSLKEMIDEFDLSGINKASAKFDIEKLRWVNQQHLFNTNDDELKSMIEAQSDIA